MRGIHTQTSTIVYIGSWSYVQVPGGVLWMVRILYWSVLLPSSVFPKQLPMSDRKWWATEQVYVIERWSWQSCGVM